MLSSHDAILRWCRSDAGKRAVGGNPVMRNLRDMSGHAVFDALSFDQDNPIAKGATWDHVLSQLEHKGFSISRVAP